MDSFSENTGNDVAEMPADHGADQRGGSGGLGEHHQLRDSDQNQRPAVWEKYLNEWVIWNHVRTITAMVSSLLIIL